MNQSRGSISYDMLVVNMISRMISGCILSNILDIYSYTLPVRILYSSGGTWSYMTHILRI